MSKAKVKIKIPMEKVTVGSHVYMRTIPQHAEYCKCIHTCTILALVTMLKSLILTDKMR